MYTFEKYNDKGLAYAMICSDDEGLDKLLKKVPKNASKFENHKGEQVIAWTNVLYRHRITVM